MASIQWSSSLSASPYVVLNVNQSSQSISNNTSTVSFSLVLHRPSYISSSASKSWSISINGNRFSGSCTIGGSGNKTIKSGSVTIPHNSDGSKSFSFSFSLDLEISWSGHWLGTASNSGSMSLSTIPRKSSFSVSNGSLNSSLTFSISKASSSFTSTIVYKCGSASGTIVSKSSSSSISWTPPLSLASQNVSGTKVSISFTLTTFNGNSSIGSTSSTISCSIPASVKPSISNIVFSDVNGYYSDFGSFICGFSKPKFTISASSLYGASIVLYTVSSSNDGSFSSSSNVINCNNLISNAPEVFTIKVKDSRGRVVSSSVTLPIVDYFKPVVERFNISRCDSDGFANDEGEFAFVDYKVSFCDINNSNNPSIVIKHKSSSNTSSDSWIVDESLDSLTSFIVEDSFIVSADSSFTWIFNIVLNDGVSNVLQYKNLSTGIVVMNFSSSGKSVAFGKVAEEDFSLDCGFDNLIIRKNVKLNSIDNNAQRVFIQNLASVESKNFDDDGVYPHNYLFTCKNSSTHYGLSLYENNTDNSNDVSKYDYMLTYSNLLSSFYFFRKCIFEEPFKASKSIYNYTNFRVTVPANGNTTVNYTFDTTLCKVPSVFACIAQNTTIPDLFSLTCFNISASGCSVRVKSNHSSDYTLGISVIAFAILT